MKMNTKEIAERIGHHGMILVTGLKRTIYGAATLGLVALAGYGFAMIPDEDGYVAVLEFILSAATLAVALRTMYAMGKGGRKGRY